MSPDNILEFSTDPTEEIRIEPSGSAACRTRFFKGDDDPVVTRSNLVDVATDLASGFSAAGAIEPSIDPLALVRIFQVSNSLRQNVDAMVQNIHGGSITFEPIMDLDSKDAWSRIRSAIIIERELAAEVSAMAGLAPEEISEPTDDEVQARIDDLQGKSWRELVRLRAFFRDPCAEYSFTRFRKKIGTDLEVTGYAAAEVMRDQRGLPRRLRHAPAWTMRAVQSGPPVDVTSQVQISDVATAPVSERRVFRRFVQVQSGCSTTYFREFGDPRVMSSKSGRYYSDLVDLQRAEGTASVPATEVLWFSLDNPESEIYGLVRWSGALISAVGSREMEEANLHFWSDRAIPAMVVLVSGGRLASTAKAELEQLMTDQIKGRRNIHRTIILEAESGPGAGISGALSQQVRIEFKPLTEALLKDQLWAGYDAANRNKVGQSFRIPPILRGDTADFNRATADAALRYADDQVFQPEREEWDWEINRTLVAALGCSLWRFKSLAPRSDDPASLLDVLVKLADTVMSPDEARRVAARALNADLPGYGTQWSRTPAKFAIAGFSPDVEEPLAEGAAAPVTLEAPQRVRVSPEQWRRIFHGEPEATALTPGSPSTFAGTNV